MEEPSVFEVNYTEGENGKIVKNYIYRGEELATKSDVYGWFAKGRKYTDFRVTRFNMNIWMSVGIAATSMILSLITLISLIVSAS